MSNPSYQQEGLVIGRIGSAATTRQVKDLQRDLRQLGYLRVGIDGKFGLATETAVKALQYDLLHNDGRSIGHDGKAPVSVLDYNRGRVVQLTGRLDQGLAACIRDMVSDTNFPCLPKTDEPKAENGRLLTAIGDMQSNTVPVPFLMGILQQESGLKHYHEPRGADEDTFINVGLDINAGKKYIITSRGYGAGQYTLFHHPPRREEIKDFMLDVEKNLQKAMQELRQKFDHFVNGPTSGTRADDRIAEQGSGPLRLCRYPTEDERYMRDCRRCMVLAGQIDIKEGVSRLYQGSKHTFEPTEYYKKSTYRAVPQRKSIGCDWPYAVRRYNGAGINSYHYQTIVLTNVLKLPA